MSQRKMNIIQLNSIDLNNRAIPLISAGKLNAATQILTKALITSQQLLDNDCTEVEKDENHSRLDEWMTLPSAFIDTEDVDAEEKHNDEVGYIYSRPIAIPISEAYDEDSCVSVCAAVVFNLALAQHLSAQQFDTEEVELQLGKAVKLYELAFNLQREAGHVSSAFFCMAAINNLGAIYNSLNDSVKSRRCFEHLLSTLMYVIDSGDSEENTEHEYHGFFRNTSHLYSTRSAAPAA